MRDAGAPDKGVLEGLLERAVDLVAHVLDCRVAPHNESLVEVGVHSFSTLRLAIMFKSQRGGPMGGWW